MRGEMIGPRSPNPRREHTLGKGGLELTCSRTRGKASNKKWRDGGIERDRNQGRKKVGNGAWESDRKEERDTN